MFWQILTVGLFTTWLSLGAAIGIWVGPLRHMLQPGAFHVQSLYVAHDAPPLQAAKPEQSPILVVER